MPLKSLFQNSYFYLFLGCMGTLGSLGITLFMAENANSAPIPDQIYNNLSVVSMLEQQPGIEP